MGLMDWKEKPVFNRKDIEYHSFHHSVERGDIDSLQRLIDTDLRHCITLVDSVNVQDGLMKGTPLHTAAEEGNVKVAKFLLINEANVMAKDRHGSEPLHLAAHRGFSDLIDLFILKGALVNNKNFSGDTALHYAANKGHNEAVSCLIRHGAVVSSRNGNGWTPLHLAVVSAHFETVKILVTRGADLNGQDSKGNTPLHLACECNNIGMVEFLLKQGAKTSIENKNHQIPGDLSSRKVIRDIVGWTQNSRRRSSSNSSTSTSNERDDSQESQKDVFQKPKPLENKFLTSVKSQANQGGVMNSPESFQDRMKRKTREMRMSQKKILLKKDDGGQGQQGQGRRKSKFNWNKNFLKKYNLSSKNLFAP